MSSDIISEEEQKLVKKATSELLEHFDSVRILVTKHDGNSANTAQFDHGGGNFYAQLGQVHEWLEIQRQFAKNHAIKRDKENEEGS